VSTRSYCLIDLHLNPPHALISKEHNIEVPFFPLNPKNATAKHKYVPTII